MKKFAFAVALIASVFLTAATSRAATVTYTNGLFDSPLLIPTFDTNLGSLTSVRVSFTLTNATVSAVNTSPDFTDVFTASEHAAIAVSGSAGLAFTGTYQSLFSGTLPALSPLQEYDATGFAFVSGTASQTVTSNLAEFGAAGGAGDVEFFVTPTYSDFAWQLVVGEEGTLGIDPPANYAGTLAVEYTYSAVPEPSTCAMTLAGLACGYGVWRRHRRA